MGRRTLITIVSAVVLLVAGAVGAYAWDSAKRDQIAEGITIGGIDVGGLSQSEAEQRIRQELVDPLSEPITVNYRDQRFTLEPRELEVRADVAGVVQEAVDASQAGGLPTRVWRYATGGEVIREFPSRVAYSQEAVNGFVEGVAAKLNQDPQDATISPTATSLEPIPEQDGFTLRQEELQEDVEQAIETPGSQQVQASVDRVEPEITTDDLATNYPVYLTVDRGSFTLRLFENLKLSKEYTIAVGQVGYDTPTGLYSIQNKSVDPVWNVPNEEWAGDLAGTVVPGGVPENPLKERWMGIYNGAGIHGTDDLGSLGTAASHGCIRMAVPDVIELYDQVSVGTPVYIQ